MLTRVWFNSCGCGSMCSGADVYDRVSTFLETLYRDMEKGGCGNNAVLVSHGLFCRLFLMRYYHWKVRTRCAQWVGAILDVLSGWGLY